MHYNTTQNMLVTILLLIGFTAVHTADPVDQVASQGAEILSKSRTGDTVRQCSCSEQQECTKEMKTQVKECAVPCFNEFSSITPRPNDLKRCFDDRDDLVQGFLTCFEQKIEGCVPDLNGPQIPKISIPTLFTVGEHHIVNQSAAIQSIIAPIKHIVDAAGEFAKCVKDCFLARNANGFCFDRKNCQPLVQVDKAKNSFRQCTRKMNWKREIGEFCECSVSAGVSDLKQYCAMFRLMGRRAGKRRS
ncbi:unnamed protein product [Cylicocyclus nassatus]|uniref:Uncharacterized protein n=1 Tax=Cylicocyclus nassatus TaxID=53992 RepID=A0AA36H481_CYLNA|nr:unnamed protein product [Cylicocyclus nassatus]